MSERDQFESWVKFHSDDDEVESNLMMNAARTNYLHADIDNAWIAWRASREALKAEQKPIGEVHLGEYDDTGSHPDAKVVCLHDQADWENFPEGTKLYLNPQPCLPSHRPIDTTPNQYDALGKGEGK